MLLDVRQCVQLDAIHANNADDMQLHGDTRAACDGDGVMNGVRCHVTRRFVKTMTWMIPGGGYSEIFGHNCCTIVGYAKSDLVDSGATLKDGQKVWKEKVLPYILEIAK